MTKSDNPDVLINIFTKREKVSVNQFNAGWGYGWGWGWNPYIWGGQQTSQLQTLKEPFIDLIDAKKQELIWQGEGVGYITKIELTKRKESMSLLLKF
jgi:hypothetical protein